MGKKVLKGIYEDVIKSFDFVPRYITIAFWFAGFFELMGYDYLSKYTLYASFFVMTILMFNFIMKSSSLKIIAYADKESENDTKTRK